MCNIDQQKEALRNVAYSADGTWTGDLCAFQRANMNLYLSARRVKAKTSKWARLTPRTVRDSIPQSRLAQYANYEYDDARELSYSPMVMKFERIYDTFDRAGITEPWMLEEIDNLFIGFLSSQNEFKSCRDNHEILPCSEEFCDMSYESPFLEAENFDEMALRLKIVSQNLKKIWDCKYYPYYVWHPTAKVKDFVLYKSPACQMFSSVKKEIEESDWLKDTSETDDNFTHIKSLAERFKEQNTWIFKKQSSRSWLESHQDVSPHKRLYSAVLQGSSPAEERNPITNFQFPPVKSRGLTKSSETAPEPSESSQSNAEQPQNNNRRMADVNAVGFHAQQGYSYYSTPVTSVFTNYQYFPQTSAFLSPRLYSNNFIPNASVLNFRQTNYFPLVLQNTAPYAQPPYFNLPRGTFPSYRTVVFPQRPQVIVPSSGWFLQPQVKIAQPPVNLLPSRPPPIHTSSYHYRPRLQEPCCSKDDFVNQELENIVAKTVSAVLDDPDPYVPVTGVSSEELELQALEQYSHSNTNVFQELERQAAEQYETSENWTSPPECHDRVTFGGYLNVRLIRFRCAEGILGLDCSNTVKDEITNLVLEESRL